MKKNISLIVSLFLFISCQQDYRFQNFVNTFQSVYLEQFKVPRHQPLIIIPAQKIHEDLDFCKKQLETLEDFDLKKLSPDNQAQLRTIVLKLRRKLSQIQAFQTEPDSYNIHPALQTVLDKKDWELEKRLMLLQKQLTLTPLFYKTAIQNLKDVDAKNAKTTWEQHIKTFMLLDQELPKLLQQSGWSKSKKEAFLNDLVVSQTAVKDYIAYCRSIVLNR